MWTIKSVIKFIRMKFVMIVFTSNNSYTQIFITRQYELLESAHFTYPCPSLQVDLTATL